MNIPGLGNLQKQVMKMQQDMEKAQEELDAERLETSAGGGMITVTTSGLGELIDLKISPEVVDPNDVELLQDMVLTAVRDAMKKAQDHHADRMSQITGGLGGKLPGLGSPLGF